MLKAMLVEQGLINHNIIHYTHTFPGTSQLFMDYSHVVGTIGHTHCSLDTCRPAWRHVYIRIMCVNYPKTRPMETLHALVTIGHSHAPSHWTTNAVLPYKSRLSAGGCDNQINGIGLMHEYMHRDRILSGYVSYNTNLSSGRLS